METQPALTRFYNYLKDQGRSPATISAYNSRLRHLALDYPELPLTTDVLEDFLKARKETPAHRGDVFKNLQSFYSYLEKVEGITSPVPSKGPIGRPRKQRRGAAAPAATYELDLPQPQKLVQGGMGSTSVSMSIVTRMAVDQFLSSLKIRGKSAVTIKTYRSILRPFMNRFSLVPVTYERIEPYFDNPHWGQEARHDARKVLVTFYNFLYQRGKLPKHLVEFPPIEHTRERRRILTREDLTSLLPHCRNFLEKCILHTLIDTKCRRSELWSMTREKIWPDHAEVTGKMATRNVPLSRETYDMLCQLAPAGPLFCIDGRPIHVDTITKWVHKIMVRAGLSGKKLGPHILRHTTSVESIMEGEDLQTLQQELGHTTPVMTAHYAHLADRQVFQRHQEINLAGKIFGGARAAEAPDTAEPSGAAGLSPPPSPMPATAPVVDEKTGSGVGVVSNIKGLTVAEFMARLKGGKGGIKSGTPA